MQRIYIDTVTDAAGNVLANADLYVYLAGTSTPATVYSDNGITPVVLPLVTDGNGQFTAYAANGRYDIKVVRAGYDDTWYWDLILDDPTDPFSGLDLSLADFTGANASNANVTAAGTVVARTLANRFGTVVDLIDNGGDPTGASDCTQAFLNCISKLSAAGGGVLVIPPGRFRKDKTGQLTLPTNVSVIGYGCFSVVVHNDVDSLPRQDLFQVANGANTAIFKDFVIEGVWNAYPSQTNGSMAIVAASPGGVEYLELSGVEFKQIRLMATAFTAVNRALVTNCTLDTVARDGIRFSNGQNITISNNHFKYVGDNAVALHSNNSTAEPLQAGNYVVTGNTFTHCVMAIALGAKRLVYSNNIHRFCVGGIGVTHNSPEGTTAMFGVEISGNQFWDTWATYGAQTVYPIQLTGVPRQAGTAAAVPGYPDTGTGNMVSPYGYFEVNNIITDNRPSMGMWGVTISDNIVARTLPIGAQFTAATAYGQRFDPNNVVGGFYDATLADANLPRYTIALGGTLVNTLIKDNVFSGTQVTNTDASHIHYFEYTTSSNSTNFRRMHIAGNMFLDCPRGAIKGSYTVSSTAEFKIIDNTFDCDPYFTNPSRVAGNKWTTATDCPAIAMTSATGVIIELNRFWNCSTPYTQTGTVGHSNWAFGQFVAAGFNANNRGVGTSNQGSHRVINVQIQGDPTAANFGEISGAMPLLESAAMPSSGFYIVGHFVKNPAATESGAVGSKYTVTGWIRTTTGTNHVLNTDWLECRALTGN